LFLGYTLLQQLKGRSVDFVQKYRNPVVVLVDEYVWLTLFYLLNHVKEGVMGYMADLICEVSFLLIADLLRVLVGGIA